VNSPALKISIGRARRGLGSLLPGQVYVGRPSPLGNPYALGRDGSREQVIAQYRRWLWAQLQSPGSPQECELRRLLAQARSGELELLCWCAPPAVPCGGGALGVALVGWAGGKGRSASRLAGSGGGDRLSSKKHPPQ
jgi:hypothetical protein